MHTCVCVCVCVCTRDHTETYIVVGGVCVSVQLIRAGSVDLEGESLVKTSSEFKKLSRPVKLIFRRRRNILRHVLRKELKDKYSWADRKRSNLNVKIMKF